MKASSLLIPVVIGFTVIALIVAAWIIFPFGIQIPIDASSLPANSTVIVDGHILRAVIPIQTIPSIINGLTTATAIIVGFAGTMIGFMVKDYFKNDKKGKNLLYFLSTWVIIIFGYLFVVYLFLTAGVIEIALRLSLFGLILALVIFVCIIIFGVYRVAKQEEAISINSVKSETPTQRVITQEQALEIADKYLVYCGKFALKNNISVRLSCRGWEIIAITTPIILGMKTEIENFHIDMKTGEVGASITHVILEDVIDDALKKIRERKDIDETKKEQLNTKVEELKDSANRTDKNKMDDLKKWFEKNGPYLKSIIDLINTLLSKWEK
jgi:hypothetical protein